MSSPPTNYVITSYKLCHHLLQTTPALFGRSSGVAHNLEVHDAAPASPARPHIRQRDARHPDSPRHPAEPNFSSQFVNFPEGNSLTLGLSRSVFLNGNSLTLGLRARGMRLPKAPGSSFSVSRVRESLPRMNTKSPPLTLPPSPYEPHNPRPTPSSTPNTFI